MIMIELLLTSCIILTVLVFLIVACLHVKKQIEFMITAESNRHRAGYDRFKKQQERLEVN